MVWLRRPASWSRSSVPTSTPSICSNDESEPTGPRFLGGTSTSAATSTGPAPTDPSQTPDFWAQPWSEPLRPPIRAAYLPTADQAFLAFDKLIQKLPAGVQLFSLLVSQPRLLTLLAAITGAAPKLSATISRRPP